MLATTIAATTACGDPDPAVNTGPVPPVVTITAGGAAEVNLDVPAGSRVTAVYAAPVPMMWDVHVHRGDQVEIRQQGTDPAGTVVVEPDTGGVYSMLWHHATAIDVELDLALTLDGGATIISWSTR